MYKIAVLGDYDSIYGFAALGLDTFPVTEREQAAAQLSRLASGGYGIIYITESWAAQLEREIASYETQVTPAIPARELRRCADPWKQRLGRTSCSVKIKRKGTVVRSNE